MGYEDQDRDADGRWTAMGASAAAKDASDRAAKDGSHKDAARVNLEAARAHIDAAEKTTDPERKALHADAAGALERTAYAHLAEHERAGLGPRPTAADVFRLAKQERVAAAAHEKAVEEQRAAREVQIKAWGDHHAAARAVLKYEHSGKYREDDDDEEGDEHPLRIAARSTEKAAYRADRAIDRANNKTAAALEKRQEAERALDIARHEARTGNAKDARREAAAVAAHFETIKAAEATDTARYNAAEVAAGETRERWLKARAESSDPREIALAHHDSDAAESLFQTLQQNAVSRLDDASENAAARVERANAWAARLERRDQNVSPEQRENNRAEWASKRETALTKKADRQTTESHMAASARHWAVSEHERGKVASNLRMQEFYSGPTPNDAEYIASHTAEAVKNERIAAWHEEAAAVAGGDTPEVRRTIAAAISESGRELRRQADRERSQAQEEAAIAAKTNWGRYQQAIAIGAAKAAHFDREAARRSDVAKYHYTRAIEIEQSRAGG